MAVIGAGGYLGRQVVASLAASDHEVRGLVRRREQANSVQRLGGHAVIGDVVTGQGLAEALKECDQVIHLAQPGEGDLEARRRVRVEGCRQIVRAAVASHVARLIVGSGYWVYRSNPGTIVEDSPIDPRSISLVNREAETVALEAAAPGGLEVVIARPGMVYGNGSWFRQMVEELRSGTYRYFGDGSHFLSPVHLEDAGTAFGTLVDWAQPGETYLVVDDGPVTTRTFAEYVAGRLGVPAPTGLPRSEAVKEWGEDLVVLESASRRASNAKLRELGWVPRYRSYTDGVPLVLESILGG